MNIQTFYVVFHKPKWKWTGVFGHVEVCGVTTDDDWFFYNPSKKGGDLDLVYQKDQVELYLAVTFSDKLVLRLEKPGKGHSPILPMMSCAGIVAHLVGFSAFTPWGLKRQLLRNGAEVIFDGRRKRKQGSQGSTPSGAAAVGARTGDNGPANLGLPDF